MQLTDRQLCGIYAHAAGHDIFTDMYVCPNMINSTPDELMDCECEELVSMEQIKRVLNTALKLKYIKVVQDEYIFDPKTKSYTHKDDAPKKNKTKFKSRDTTFPIKP